MCIYNYVWETQDRTESELHRAQESIPSCKKEGLFLPITLPFLVKKKRTLSWDANKDASSLPKYSLLSYFDFHTFTK